MLNFDSLPTEKPSGERLKGRYTAKVETAEMKAPKDTTKPDYLSMRLTILDAHGSKVGSVFDILTESESPLARYKLGRFITATQLPLKNFELKDLPKIIIGKTFEVDLTIEEKEGYQPRTIVDALTNEIYYPIITADDIPFDADDSVDSAVNATADEEY